MQDYDGKKKELKGSSSPRKHFIEQLVSVIEEPPRKNN
jgi:hypothetical protein